MGSLKSTRARALKTVTGHTPTTRGRMTSSVNANDVIIKATTSDGEERPFLRMENRDGSRSRRLIWKNFSCLTRSY